MNPSLPRPPVPDTERVSMALAAGAIVGTWIWDLSQDGLTIDDALAKAFDLDPTAPRERVRLELLLDSIHPEDRPAVEAAIASALQRGGRYGEQYRVRLHDGGYRWIEAIGQVDHDPSGKARRFSGVLIDIDERRRIEAERDQAQALLRSFIEAAPGVVYAKDRQGRMLIGNRGTTELIGMPPEQYVGRTDAEFLADPDQAAAIMAVDERIMSSGQSEQVEEEVSFPDGTHAYWLSTKAPLRDAEGQVIGLIGTSLDITQRKLDEARHRETEERYRLAARATNDAIWDWRMSDDQVVWNEAMGDLFGHPVTQTDAAWWLDHIHPQDRDRVETTIQAVINAGGTGWVSEYRFRRIDGSYADVLDRGAVLRGEGGEPIRMIGAMLDLTERRMAEAALAESEERLRLATEAGDMGFWDVDVIRDKLIWPARTKAMFGISPGVEVSMQDFYGGLHPDDLAPTSQAFAAAADPVQRALYDVEYRTIGKEDGIVRWVAAKGRGIFVEDRCVRVVGVAIDVTERKAAQARLQELNEHLESRVLEEVEARTRIENALRQSQKMEAVGQLTGGIAHDFNNMLTTVIGPLEVLEARLGESDPRIRRCISMAQDGARRAAELTRRLLAFSRKQPLQPVQVDANALIVGMSELITRSLGSSIQLETVQSAGLWWTRVDPNQLENVILNLAVNARDAMPDGGQLRIRTANCEITAHSAVPTDVPPGQYVVIEVSDTGTGMPAEVLAKAFDPFFTTKPAGRGTGLGLSQVYGFVTQSAGHVRLESELGRGTTIRIHLPRVLQADSTPVVATSGGDACGPVRAELILVVDDEPGVLEFSSTALAELGYRVLTAGSPAAALDLLKQHREVDLLFTDVVMPGASGPQLAAAARVLSPQLKVLFTSGYTRDEMGHNGVQDPGVHLLHKPYSLDALARQVRAVLDEPASVAVA